jgi:hypothetical protein
MGIINRTQDASEQKESFKANNQAVGNAAEKGLCIIERPCTLQQFASTALGISGAPTAILRVNRFGSTSYLVGLTMLVPALGVSGAMRAASLPASGSTVLNLQKDDVISVLYGGGTGAAADNIVVDLVVQNVQDIKTWF